MYLANQTRETYPKAISALKKHKNAVVLAHYYQRPEIQDIADFVGDSLALAKQAASSNADILVFAGVHFMAETAKILNRTKKVLIPDMDAGCSLADSCQPDAFRKFRANNPDHLAITYINCSAEIKAQSDIICTSSNAKKIVESFPLTQPLLFAPDLNLGRYLIKETGRDMLLWDGVCKVHHAFSLAKVKALCARFPFAKIVAHPESDQAILNVAHFVGSTSAMIDYIISSQAQTFIVGTEIGILHQLKNNIGHKVLIPMPIQADTSCACSECDYMKMNTLEKIHACLLHETPAITLDDDLIDRAFIPLNRMLSLSI